MKLTARIVSLVFHPLLFTTYLVLVLGIFFPVILGINPTAFRLFTVFIFIVTFVFPALNMLLMFKISKSITSLSLASRKERIVPFILVSLIYVSVAIMFYVKAILGMNFIKLVTIIAAMIVISTLITLFFKISVHSLASAGFIGILMPMNKIAEGTLLLPTAIGIVVAGLIMSARLELNAHTPREVLVGALVGLAVGFGGVMLLF